MIIFVIFYFTLIIENLRNCIEINKLYLRIHYFKDEIKNKNIICTILYTLHIILNIK